jgi:hypothetical protein
VLLCRGVEAAEERAAADPDAARRRIDVNVREAREVDDEAAVAGRVARDAVAAAADGERQLFVSRASSTAAATSSTVRGRAISAGRRSIIPFQMRRAVS